MKTKNIPPDIKSKSINEAKIEILDILKRLEDNGIDLDNSKKDYERLLLLNNHVDNIFKEKLTKIHSIGKKIIYQFEMLKNIKNNAKTVDKFIKKYFKNQKYSELIPVMKYGTLFGGKKIRSTIILNTSKIFNINLNKIINVCAAVECIHSYSLIHDDLPCMDNDRLRRGKPSTHIKFGESTAILAGNSLLTLAFEMIADKKFNLDSKVKLNLIRKLSECAGHVGIAGG